MASDAAKKIAEKHNAKLAEDALVGGSQPPGNGHNSAEPAKQFAKDQLQSFVERVERLEEEKKTYADDIRDVYAEAKGTGFDVKALRAIIKLRKQDPDERAEHEAIVDTYAFALGMSE